MLGVKILINLQAGLSRPWLLLHTSDRSVGCASSCLETIEVIDPFSIRSLNRQTGIVDLFDQN